MAIADVTQAIASLAEAHRETMSLITRLRKLEGIGIEAQRTELVTLIHQSLKDSEQELELLSVHIEDLAPGDQKTSLTSKWHKLSEDTKIARAAYRKAQIEAKRNAEAARRQERDLLLGTTNGKRRVRGATQLSQDELILNASNDITSSLKRTHNMLSAELSRSQFAAETLHTSTQALKELSTRYSTFDDLLLKSRRLITDLVRKNKSDAWYYEKAIYIMVTTIVWLIIRRFLYGPFYLLVWLPLKLSWWVLSLFGSLIGAGGGYEAAVAVPSGNVKGGGESIVQVKPQVEVKGIVKDIPTIPASLLHSEEKPSPVPPPPPPPRQPFVEEKIVNQVPVAVPIEQTESLLEKVGESIDRQQREEHARQYEVRQEVHQKVREEVRQELRPDQGQQQVRHDEL